MRYHPWAGLLREGRVGSDVAAEKKKKSQVEKRERTTPISADDIETLGEFLKRCHH